MRTLNGAMHIIINRLKKTIERKVEKMATNESGWSWIRREREERRFCNSIGRHESEPVTSWLLYNSVAVAGGFWQAFLNELFDTTTKQKDTIENNSEGLWSAHRGGFHAMVLKTGNWICFFFRFMLSLLLSLVWLAVNVVFVIRSKSTCQPSKSPQQLLIRLPVTSYRLPLSMAESPSQKSDGWNNYPVVRIPWHRFLTSKR